MLDENRHFGKLPFTAHGLQKCPVEQGASENSHGVGVPLLAVAGRRSVVVVRSSSFGRRRSVVVVVVGVVVVVVVVFVVRSSVVVVVVVVVRLSVVVVVGRRRRCWLVGRGTLFPLVFSSPCKNAATGQIASVSRGRYSPCSTLALGFFAGRGFRTPSAAAKHVWRIPSKEKVC